jgi:hypothetical protein
MMKFALSIFCLFAFSAGAATVSPLLNLLSSLPAHAVGQTCHATTDCAKGENCKNGVCQLVNGPGMCLNDTECATGEHCVNNQCRR